MTEPTKTPWPEPQRESVWITGQKRLCVIENIANFCNESDARLAVRCVNAHDALKDACEAALRCMKSDWGGDTIEAAKLRAALVLARKDTEDEIHP